MIARFAAKVRTLVRRYSGVRARSAIAAAVVVALVLAVAAAAFVLLYRRALIADVDDNATHRAQAVAADVARANALTAVIPAGPGEPEPVQVLDPTGRVIAASPAVATMPPLAPLRPPAGSTEHQDRRIPPSGHDKYRVVAIGVPTDHGTYTVLVGASLEPADESVEGAVGLLAVGCPVVVLLVAGATFAFVGRALTPVEAIRRKVSVISASSLDERVPVPPARDEVARLAKTMNAMLDRIETQVETRRRFVADAGHELRSPLTTLRTGLELLAAHGDLTARDAATVEILGHESERLSRLVDGLLLLARADERGLRPDPSDVDLDDLVDAERRRLAVQHPGLRVSARIDPVRVRGDAHQLAQAIRNLADNAATHAVSTVSFATYQEAGRAVIEVADDGPGVPEADRERVFERFVRLDASRTRDSGGTGLGLAIVREVVRAHGGTVRVGAHEPTGALLRVELATDAWPESPEAR